MVDNRTSSLRREIYKSDASAVPRSSYLDRLLGGERGLGRSVQRRTVPINKDRFASIYKVASQL